MLITHKQLPYNASMLFSFFRSSKSCSKDIDLGPPCGSIHLGVSVIAQIQLASRSLCGRGPNV